MLEGYLLSYGYLLAVIFLTGLIQKLLKFDHEISRKIVHLLTGFVWLPLYKYFAGTVHFIIIPGTFVIINYVSYKFKLLKMMERETDDGNTLGTVYYAAGFAILAAVSLLWEVTLLPFGVGVFCMSFGDAAAALIGSRVKKHNRKLTKEKSLAGTLSAIVFAVVGILVFLCIVPTPLRAYQILLLGIATGLLELAGKGLDNFTVPFGITALTTLFLYGV